MKRTIAITAAAISMATSGMAEAPGFQKIKVDVPYQWKDARGAVWYPTAAPNRTKLYADNKVFQGVHIAAKAPVADGTFPIVLLSHGMGGTQMGLAWLADGLVARGAIVVTVDHPNSNFRDFDMAQGIHHWTRAQDLSLALDKVLADPTFAGRIDMSNVMVAGFSFGGWTALTMAGVRGNHAGFIAACETLRDRADSCAALLDDPVNAADVAPDAWNGDYADARITAAAAIDPGAVWGLQPDDVAGAIPNITMIGLGSDDQRMIETNFDASGLADLMGDARTVQIAPGYHFTAMPICKPEGPAILERVGDDPVCTDPEGTDRQQAHSQMIDILAKKIGL